MVTMTSRSGFLLMRPGMTQAAQGSNYNVAIATVDEAGEKGVENRFQITAFEAASLFTCSCLFVTVWR